MGGDNTKNNLVELTAQEHFICHRLLVKMTAGQTKQKMSYALWLIVNQSNQYQERVSITGRVYELIRKDHGITVSNSLKGKKKSYSSFGGKKHTDSMIQYFSEIKVGDNNPMWGKTHSDETKLLIGLGRKGAKDPTYKCHNCNRDIAGLGNYNRWHGDKCRINTK
jgi:hypothetical protein